MSYNWSSLKIGAGGMVTSIDAQPDGTMVCRTDSNGAYYWNPTKPNPGNNSATVPLGAWEQLLNADRLPSQLVGPWKWSGVHAIAIAPSNTNVFYMFQAGYVIKTTDKSQSWSLCQYLTHGLAGGDNPVFATEDVFRTWSHKMAVDPANENVVYVGTQVDGLFFTIDGGVSWTQISSSIIPVATATDYTINASTFESNGHAGYAIMFDPSSGTTGGKTNTIYVVSYGHGVYRSTDAGASWSAISTTIRAAKNLSMVGGVFYLLSSNQTLGPNSNTFWKYSGGSFTNIYTRQDIETHAVDPNNSNRIIITWGSNITTLLSFDGGATWNGGGGENGNTNHIVADDIPWLASFVPSASHTRFDLADPAHNRVLIVHGSGVFTWDVPTSGFTTGTPIVFHSKSAGIEQLISQEVIVPISGTAITATWDFAFHKTAGQFPTTYGPQVLNFNAGWSIDYASSDPNFVVGLCDSAAGGSGQKTSYSTDCGSTWNLFSSYPAGIADNDAGVICASTPNNILWCPQQKAPFYTLNGGASWAQAAFPGSPSFAGNWGTSHRGRFACADRVTPNTFYYYNATNQGAHGLYRTTDGGATWTWRYGDLNGIAYNIIMQAAPGNAGHLFWTSGFFATGAAQPNPSNKWFRSTDGGLSWSEIRGTIAGQQVYWTEVSAFGFGKAASGQAYPSIFAVGWYSTTGTNGSYTYGIFQSDDNCATWTQIGIYPFGDFDNVPSITGDMNNYGQVYGAFGGGGFFQGSSIAITAPWLVHLKLQRR